MMKVRLVAVGIVALLAYGLLGHSVSHAQSARQQKLEMERNTAQIQQNKQRSEQLKKEAGELNEVIRGYDSRINSQQKDLRQIKDQLKLEEDNLTRLNQEREELEVKLEGYREALGARMRAVYMQGDLSYLDLLFNASDFGDFVDRLFFVQTICSHDGELIDTAQQDQAKLIEQGQLIAQKLEEIRAIRAQEEARLAELQAVERQKKNDLASINHNIELYQRETAELEAQNRRITNEIRALTSSTSASRYKGKWTSAFRQPTAGKITSGFGMRRHPIFGGNRRHTGVDIAAPTGTQIVAAGDGKVIRTGWYGGYGNVVIIDHGGGRATLYGHCSAIYVAAGDEVKVGKKIAAVGSTGNSTGPHLHFEVHINGSPVDPMGKF